jgi:hypothetical protein
MKGRVTLLTVLLLLASSMTAYGSVGLQAQTTTCSRCGTLGAVHGDGVLRQTGTGVTYGTVGQGTIAILDRSDDGKVGYSVAGWEHHWTKNGWAYFSGKGMSYLAKTSWTVRINGSWGISTTTRAHGWGFIQGSGKWSLNGAGGSSSSRWPDWPSGGRSFTLSS